MYVPALTRALLSRRNYPWTVELVLVRYTPRHPYHSWTLLVYAHTAPPACLNPGIEVETEQGLDCGRFPHVLRSLWWPSASRTLVPFVGRQVIRPRLDYPRERDGQQEGAGPWQVRTCRRQASPPLSRKRDQVFDPCSRLERPSDTCPSGLVSR